MFGLGFVEFNEASAYVFVLFSFCLMGRVGFLLLDLIFLFVLLFDLLYLRSDYFFNSFIS